MQPCQKGTGAGLGEKKQTAKEKDQWLSLCRPPVVHCTSGTTVCEPFIIFVCCLLNVTVIRCEIKIGEHNKHYIYLTTYLHCHCRHDGVLCKLKVGLHWKNTLASYLSFTVIRTHPLPLWSWHDLTVWSVVFITRLYSESSRRLNGIVKGFKLY